MTSRRSLLQAIALAPLLGACAAGNSTVRRGSLRNYTPSGAPLRRVRVSTTRVIRTIAGLRPFRQSGFVVKAQQMNDKIVIHNYGHGGSGWSLSWGAAALAEQQIQPFPDNLLLFVGITIPVHHLVAEATTATADRITEDGGTDADTGGVDTIDCHGRRLPENPGQGSARGRRLAGI